jgi:hypothetical protein
MTKRGYNFYTVNTTKETRLRNQEEVDKGEDTIHVYKDGYKIEYNGIRGEYKSKFKDIFYLRSGYICFMVNGCKLIVKV